MNPRPNKSEQGSILVITIVTTTLIGTVLGSYLLLVSNRNQGTMRALAWNSAIPVLEAGIEEALTHLNFDTNNPTANQWQQIEFNGQTAYWKQGELPDGSRYFVTNVNVRSTAPLIYSAGYVPAPLNRNEYVSRLVKVTTTNPPSVFTHSIAASGAIKLSGNAIVDGYNPVLGSYGSKNRNATGDMATNSKELRAIDIGSGHLCGKAVTGPGGSVAVSGGSVGDLNWPLTAGIKEGWTNNDMNVQFQDVAAPTGNPRSLVQSPDGSYLLTADSSSVVYTAGSFVCNSASRPIIVPTGKHVTLYITGDFSVSGDGFVKIEENASLNLYVGGKANISGGGVVNAGGMPKDFAYYGLTTSSVLYYSGEADFYGTINAPQADVRISGNSSVYGAVICKTFTSSGSSNVHYDESLKGGGLFIVTSWRELPSTTITAQ